MVNSWPLTGSRAPSSPAWAGRPLRRTPTPRRRCRCVPICLRSCDAVLDQWHFARIAAGGVKPQNRRAGPRWHRAASVGCAGASPAPLCPFPSTHWTQHIAAVLWMGLSGCASTLTDHPVLTHARRRVRGLKYDRQRGRGRRDGRRRLPRRRFRSRHDHRLRARR